MRLSYNSPVILSFALLSLGALVLGELTGGDVANVKELDRRGLNVCLITDGPICGPQILLISAGDAVRYGIDHMRALRMITINPARALRVDGALALSIAATALVSALAQWLLFPDTALLGASGIVFMLIVMASLSGMRRGELPLTLLLVLVLYLGQEVLAGLFTRDNISQLTHIIGGLMGAVLGFALRRA